MGWLFGQVWILCTVAFLAGAGVTWAAFVRPLRRGAGPSTPGPAGSETWEPHTWSPREDGPEPPAAAAPARPVDPAVTALDDRERPRRVPGIGGAVGALDLLGVPANASGPGAAARASDAAEQQGPPDPVVHIPAQTGPADMSRPRPGDGAAG